MDAMGMEKRGERAAERAGAQMRGRVALGGTHRGKMSLKLSAMQRGV